MNAPPSKRTWEPTPRLGKRFERREGKLVPALEIFTEEDKAILRGLGWSPTIVVS